LWATNGYNTSKEILLDLKTKDGEKVAGWILDYRTNRKILSTYLERASTDIDFDGRIRYSFFQLTSSARLSCRFLHQIPRTDESRVRANLPVLRDMFIAREGYTYLYMDYSQIELRVLAILAQDKTMTEMFLRGEDIHKATAACLLGCKPEEVVKYNRSLGKAVNFGLAYGSKGSQLVKKGDWIDDQGVKQPVTWEMLNRGLENFKRLFPGITQYLEDTPMVARVQGGTLRTVFGRERRLGSQLNVGNDGKREAAEREAVNFTIQSTASAITLRTAILIDKLLQHYIEAGQLAEDDIVMVNTVHDSLAYEVKNEFLGWFQGALKQIAERPIPELQNHKFPCDMGTGRSWTTAELDAH
jgi:DNA polymerase-1